MRRRRRSSSLGAAPVIRAAGHFYHEKRVAWVSISMRACDPVPIVVGLRLAALRRSSAKKISKISPVVSNAKFAVCYMLWYVQLG